MTQEEKNLLLQDLCARLPYGVMVNIKSRYEDVFETVKLNGHHIFERWYNIEYMGMKPYLRPMSSMTEEEKEQTRDLWIDADIKTHATRLIDFYNKHHLDYRGLIEKGLALEAPEGMYKN